MKRFKTSYFFSILVVVVMLMGAGCKNVQPAVHTVHDSVYVERTQTVTVTDTVFYTEPAHVSLQVPYDTFKASLKPVSKTVNNATLTVERRGSIVQIDCDCDTVKIRAQLLHTLEKEYKDRSKVITEVAPPVAYVPWYIRVLAWIGGISLILRVCLVSFKKLWR